MKLSPRKAALSVVALAALAYGFMEFRGPGGFAGLSQKRAELQALDEENQRLRAENEKLRKRIGDLDTNPEAQALEIRKRYHMVKPGETMYVLQDKKPAVK